MKKSWHLPSWRHGARAGRGALLASAAFLLAPQPGGAWAQSCTVSDGACTIPSGNYSQPYAIGLYESPVTATNDGTFTITTGAGLGFLGALEFDLLGGNGQNSSSGDAGNAGNGGTLTFINNGAISQTISSVLNSPTSAVMLYTSSLGGNGGNYTNTDNEGDAGAAGQSNVVTVTNNANLVMVNAPTAAPPSTLVFGGVLLADSRGGNGGSVAASGVDSDGNPTYRDDGRGSNGGYAAAVTVTNQGSVTANLSGGPNVSQGFVGVGARALGGNAGSGPNGPSGGASGHATVTNTANVSLSVGWGAASGFAATIPVTQGAFAVLAQSRGGFGTQAVASDKNGGVGGNAGQATVTAGLAGTPVTISLATTNAGNLATTPSSAAIAAMSQGGNGGAGWRQTAGGAGGQTGLASVTTLDSLTVRATGDRTLGILALSQGGAGGNSGVGQSNSAAGNGGSTGAADSTTPYASIDMTNTTVTTTGALSAGVMAMTRGGDGGTGLDYTSNVNPDSKAGRPGRRRRQCWPGLGRHERRLDHHFRRAIPGPGRHRAGRARWEWWAGQRPGRVLGRWRVGRRRLAGHGQPQRRGDHRHQ